MHYYQFNIGEYASHTRHLSPIEDIAYRRLLDLAYTSEQPLIKDIHQLARLINLREYKQEVEDVLKEFFFEVDDGWLNNRVIKEIEKTGRKSEAAKNSVAIRWDNERKAKLMQSQSERNTSVLKNNTNVHENDTTNNQLPITNNQLPITNNQLPNTNNQEPRTNKVKNIVADKPAPTEKTEYESELQLACRQTWKFYSDAFFNRYGTEPVRNAKVNGQVKQFVKRIGFEESPFVAALYVSNNTQYYVGRGHSIDCLLADAEKLRMEWATGNTMTATMANQIDKSQANKSAVNEAMQLLGVAQ